MTLEEAKELVQLMEENNVVSVSDNYRECEFRFKDSDEKFIMVEFTGGSKTRKALNRIEELYYSRE